MAAPSQVQAAGAMTYESVGGLKVAKPLYDLVRDEIAPGTGIDPPYFWASLGAMVKELGPKNRALLDKRDDLQAKIDDWHRVHRGQYANRQFLYDIGYLAKPVPGDYRVQTANVDAEFRIAGPQLVTPLDKTDFVLKAANARWRSLFGDLYGTNAIDSRKPASKEYDHTRGAKVIERTDEYLDAFVPLKGNRSHKEALDYVIRKSDGKTQLYAVVRDRNTAQKTVTIGLRHPSKFVGYNDADDGLSILLKNNNLHIELQVDGDDPIGKTHHAGIKDVLLEAALTTIMDCEDAVSAVDAHDKARVYRTWNGVMEGTLTETIEKGGDRKILRLNEDRHYISPTGKNLTLPGRSMLLVRNVGIHLYTDAVKTADNQEIPEGFLDAMVTALAAKHDLLGNGKHRNSKENSIYIVKPKLHGPEEVAATVEQFGYVERVLGLKENTIKLGIMDEERRTSVNLDQCIYAARNRVVFINTGFLDRTGDEIHTSMQAGAMLPTARIRGRPWLQNYEDHNAYIGLKRGVAQVGKGMWVKSDEMAEMLEAKIVHPLSGANTAWVPSPPAAVLHALHYHMVNVAQKQKEILSAMPSTLDDVLSKMLVPPLLSAAANGRLAPEEVQNELNNLAQGMLGYVSRWVGQGIGCSKVPDIQNISLMEDLATLRIKSQLLGNWLRHEDQIVSETTVHDAFKRMAEVVDGQNAEDAKSGKYAPMYGNFDGPEFKAAWALVKNAHKAPNGYTERTLRYYRRLKKEILAAA